MFKIIVIKIFAYLGRSILFLFKLSNYHTIKFWYTYIHKYTHTHTHICMCTCTHTHIL